jgi:HSP20 family protein
MAIRDLIPWHRSRDVTVRRGGETDPFLMFHREMNRLFEDFSRGFGLAPFGQERCSVELAAGPTSRSLTPTRR